MKTLLQSKWFAIAAIVLLLANTATVIYMWQQRKHHRPPMPPIDAAPTSAQTPTGARVRDFLIRELGLNETQQQQYDELIKEHQAGMKPMRDSIKMQKEAFYHLLRKDSATEQELTTANNHIAAIELRLNRYNFAHLKKLRVICDTAQQRKFDGIIEQVLMGMNLPKQNGPAPEQRGQQAMPPKGKPDSLRIKNGRPPMGPHPDGPPPGHHPLPHGERPPRPDGPFDGPPPPPPNRDKPVHSPQP